MCSRIGEFECYRSISQGDGHSHMLCSHNCDHGQSAGNGQNGFLAAGQRSPKTVALTCSKPIITLLFPQCSPAFSKTSSLLLPQVPDACDAVCSMQGTPKGSKVTVSNQDPKILCSQRSNCEKLMVKILTAVAVVTTGHMGVTPLAA